MRVGHIDTNEHSTCLELRHSSHSRRRRLRRRKVIRRKVRRRRSLSGKGPRDGCKREFWCLCVGNWVVSPSDVTRLGPMSQIYLYQGIEASGLPVTHSNCVRVLWIRSETVIICLDALAPYGQVVNVKPVPLQLLWFSPTSNVVLSATAPNILRRST